MSKEIKLRLFDISYLPLLLSAVVTVSVVYLIFGQTQDILTSRLKERLIAISSTASIQFNEEDIVAVENENDLNSPELARIVLQLQKIRDLNKDIRFIYIWKKTDNPHIVKFVADAEMLAPIDTDANGIIEGEEIPPLPGEDYDISETPEVEIAFQQPTTTTEFISDKWGTFASSWAPIFDKKGSVIAIIGIDVQINDFYRLISSALLPFVLLAILLLLILSIQTIYLVRIWKSRVQIVEELDTQKDELLSIVSHQLATPVSSIKWYLEMLADGDLGKLNKGQLEHVQNTQKIIENMSDLVSMILDVSRIQLGKIRIEKQPIDLKGLFEEIKNTVSPKAKEKNIDLIYDVPQKWPEANLDKRLTRMTIENILSNAIKYTPVDGRVSLSVKIENNFINIRVEDSGCGIPIGDQGKIFGKLYRASNVRNNIDGNGFGLYISKGATESQGGEIGFKSEEGKGTIFSVKLPLR